MPGTRALSSEAAVVAPWPVIHDVRDAMGASMAGAMEGGQISSPTEGFCGHRWHNQDTEDPGWGHGAGLVIQLHTPLLLPRETLDQSGL